MFLATSIINYQFSQWRFRFYWLKHAHIPKKTIHAVLGICIGLLAVIVLQIAYPRNLALPGTRVGNQYLGFRYKSNIVSRLNSLNNQTAKIEIEGQTVNTSLSNTGLSVDGEETVKKALNYSWRERLIPFTVFAKRNTQYEITVNEAKLKGFVAELDSFNKAPVDAALKIEGVEPKITPSRTGVAYNSQKTEESFRNWIGNPELKIHILPSATEPAILTEAAEQAASTIKQRIDTPLSVEAAGQSLKIDGPTLASWMILSADPAKGNFQITYDRAKVKATLATLSDRVYIAQTPTRVTMLDGEITASNSGSNGQALVVEESIEQLMVAAQTNASTYQAKVQPVTPATQVTRSYSRTSKGIQAVINYWVQTHYGQYGIAMQSADGAISASYNPNKQFTSASTYKLYMAYVVYSKVASGEIILDEVTSTGATVASCIDAMIVRSDNNCARALGDRVGWQATDGMLHAKGFTSTTLTSGNLLTTANDGLSWVKQAHNGTLLPGSYNNDLIAMMKRQIYRTAIPAGAPNSVVADKVGDYYALHHDVAIVYNPKGTYLLSIYSYGAVGYPTLADLARQINNVMSQ